MNGQNLTSKQAKMHCVRHYFYAEILAYLFFGIVRDVVLLYRRFLSVCAVLHFTLIALDG
jgi:hypothetical protein